MLRTLLYGAVAAFVGSKLKKMNDEGKLEPYKDRARKRAQELKDKLAEHRQTSGTQEAAHKIHDSVSSKTAQARPSTSPDVSKPAKAHPWPADPKAMPN